MKKDYTILIPNMAPIHFEILKNIFADYGYNMELLKNEGRAVVDAGLKYVHNDTCYPALLVIGQMIDALQSGKYDLNKTALIITQTGGGCRASNYIHLLRKALKKAGMGQVPVISLNMSGLEKNSGFKLRLSMIRKALAALAYGDLIMQLSNQTRPYEVVEGETDRVIAKWTDKLVADIIAGKGVGSKDIQVYLNDIAASFAEIQTVPNDKVIKVGIVGEIYVKYSPLANNHLEEFLRTQNCEVMVPGIMGFALFKVDNRLEDIKLYGGSKAKKFVCTLLMNYLTKVEGMIIDACKPYPQFVPPSAYVHTKELVKNIIGYGCKMGEGWLLTAEMVELTELGYNNIVCAQPFGCLPNHIVGKGMIRRIKELHPTANIVPIDYDPGATKVNQENRIKLMLSVAAEQNRTEHKAKKVSENHETVKA